MKKKLLAALVLSSLLLTLSAYAEDNAQPAEPAAQPAPVAEAAAEEANPLAPVQAYRWFVNQYRYLRDVRVTYYDNVYAYNHGDYGLTPFAAVVPPEFFVEDTSGALALAPIVLDVTDAMRERLYGGDYGETAMYYGQFCERIRAKDGRTGFSGVHEGIDFINEKNSDLHAILGGEVTRAGDSNGTVGVYNAEHDVTLLYLHCEDIQVRRGDELEAGDVIASEGSKKAGSYYTHVELRMGRHTSSSAYRDTKLTSDCPYAVMQAALGVTESGRQPVTAAAVLEAQRMREEAEAAAKAEEEAALAEEAKNAEPDIELVDTLDDALPGANDGYGFADATASPVPEATLPPTNP